MIPELTKLPQAFEGRRVFILGGGPSIARLDLDLFRDRDILACNATALLLPFVPPWAVFGDYPFLRGFRRRLRERVKQGMKLINAVGRTIHPEDHWMLHIKRINGSKNWGIQTQIPSDRGSTVVSWNRSTGGCAINVAVAMGAKEIVLVGFDMRQEAGRHNWHNEYAPHEKSRLLVKPASNIYSSHFVKPFPRIMADLDRLGIKMWTMCDQSGLNGVVPYRSVEDLL